MALRNADDRESAAIIAGLRILQAWHENRVTMGDAQLDVSIDDIESDGGAHNPMTSEEIDEFVERINCQDGICVESGL